MTTRPQVVAERREVIGKKVALLRRAGKLPAVVYGHGHESESIALDAHEFDVLRRRVGRNTLLDLSVGGRAPQPVLLHGIHEHPVTRRVLHADFYVVEMTEEMTVEVPIVMVGESLAIERLGGTLLHLKDTIQVRALPTDLPSSLELDVTPLDTFEATLHVSDLHVPDKVTIVTDPSEPIARVQQPRIVEVEAAPAVEVEGEAVAEGEAGAAEGGADAEEGSSEG